MNSGDSLQIILFMAALFSLYVVVLGLRYEAVKRRGVRSPFIEDFLRLPGHSERLKRLDIFDELSDKYNLFLFSSVLLIAATLFFSSVISILLFLVALVGIFFSLRSALKLHTRIQEANLVCDGEEYTGQELNFLWSEGASVFHDLSFGESNIDHVVVGHDKLFVVETAIFGKTDATGADSSIPTSVKFNGKTLAFPHLITDDPIKHAEERAKYLAWCIREKCNIDYQVMPVVALPGWHVTIDRKRKAELLVINPKRGTGLKAWLGNKKNEAVREEVLQYIASLARSNSPRSRRTDSQADEQYELWLSPRFRDRILGE